MSKGTSKEILTGLFSMVVESGKSIELYMDDETLTSLGVSTGRSPEELFVVWWGKVRPEDRVAVEKAINGTMVGVQSEVSYVFHHDIYGDITLTSVGVVSENDGKRCTIKGFFKGVAETKVHEENDEVQLYKLMLMENMVDSFTTCALMDVKKDRILFLRDTMLPDEMRHSMTYSEWRSYMEGLIYEEDLKRFRNSTDPEKITQLFDQNNNEILFETRWIDPSTSKLNRMKQRYVRFPTPLVGKYSEFFVFTQVLESSKSTFREGMRKRLINALAMPYRKLDLVNLKTGRLYSSKTHTKDYTDAFDDIGYFDDALRDYLAECVCTPDMTEEILGKFLTENLRRRLDAGEKVVEAEVQHRDAESGICEWVRIAAFQTSEDDNGKPFMAIVTIMQINTEKERELQRKQLLEYALRSERQYKGAILSTAMAVYTYNVTQDILYEETIETEGIESLLPKIGLSVPCSYDDYIIRKSRYIPSKESAEQFYKTFNRSALIDMFNSKNYTIDYEYEFDIGGRNGVFREAVILTKDFQTNEIWGLTYIRNLTQERKEKKRMELAMQEAYEQAQRANSAKTLFMSQMSHDIRTPLNSILGMANIAGEHANNAERVRECMEKIDYAGRHLLELINNVLDLSTIESGRTVMAQEEFDLGAFIDEMLNMIQPLIDKKGHTLHTKIAQMHENVCGDRLKLRQVLVNVLGNAIKYTPDGGDIRFTAEELEPDRQDLSHYRFIIEDNGIGMSDEFIENVFDPFARADQYRISNVQGTGLGMAIARNIARMMNGDITVQSELGKGSVFDVTVCLKRGEDHAPRYIGEISLEEPKKIRMSDFDFGGRRVLLAEDLEFNAEIAAEFLYEAGFQVEFAVNGAEAVRMFSESKPGYYSIILMDIQMPELDGNEAASAIRALNHPQAKDIPIIAMTANAFIEDIKLAEEAGMNGHIAKPIEIPVLAASLVQFLGDCRRKEQK